MVVHTSIDEIPIIISANTSGLLLNYHCGAGSARSEKFEESEPEPTPTLDTDQFKNMMKLEIISHFEKQQAAMWRKGQQAISNVQRTNAEKAKAALERMEEMKSEQRKTMEESMKLKETIKELSEKISRAEAMIEEEAREANENMSSFAAAHYNQTQYKNGDVHFTGTSNGVKTRKEPIPTLSWLGGPPEVAPKSPKGAKFLEPEGKEGHSTPYDQSTESYAYSNGQSHTMGLQQKAYGFYPRENGTRMVDPTTPWVHTHTPLVVQGSIDSSSHSSAGATIHSLPYAPACGAPHAQSYAGNTLPSALHGLQQQGGHGAHGQQQLPPFLNNNGHYNSSITTTAPPPPHTNHPHEWAACSNHPHYPMTGNALNALNALNGYPPSAPHSHSSADATIHGSASRVPSSQSDSASAAGGSYGGAHTTAHTANAHTASAHTFMDALHPGTELLEQAFGMGGISASHQSTTTNQQAGGGVGTLNQDQLGRAPPPAPHGMPATITLDNLLPMTVTDMGGISSNYDNHVMPNMHTFEVRLPKTSTSGLGIDVSYSGGNDVISIERILHLGAVAVYNDMQRRTGNGPLIQENDQIVKVNMVQGSADLMLEECRTTKRQYIDLTISRAIGC